MTLKQKELELMVEEVLEGKISDWFKKKFGKKTAKAGGGFGTLKTGERQKLGLDKSDEAPEKKSKLARKLSKINPSVAGALSPELAGVLEKYLKTKPLSAPAQKLWARIAEKDPEKAKKMLRDLGSFKKR